VRKAVEEMTDDKSLDKAVRKELQIAQDFLDQRFRR
jgi:hypothetical protein